MHNFYSDTQTRPSRAMREFALEAELGDEQSAADPTTRALEERVAALLGKEAAVFLPSGTMCNEIAIAIHCRPGDEVICDRSCHIINFEGGGPAALAGVMTRAVDGDRGRFTAEQTIEAIRYASRYDPRSRLVAVEQTANMGGGAVWPVAQLDAVAEAAKSRDLATHMDGARLLNAVVASGQPAEEHVAGYDSCWIDFTKGLGAAVGAALAGSAAFIEEAWRLKQRWGGAMRQSGVISAMCLYALDHHVERLAEDHELARSIAERLAQMPGVARVVRPDTNIVIFDIAEIGPLAETLVAECRADGVMIGDIAERRVRIVTHRDVDGTAAEALVGSLGARLG